MRRCCSDHFKSMHVFRIKKAEWAGICTISRMLDFFLTSLLSSNWSEKGVLIIAYLAERLLSSATRLRKFSHEIAADMRVIRSGSEGVCWRSPR